MPRRRKGTPTGDAEDTTSDLAGLSLSPPPPPPSNPGLTFPSLDIRSGVLVTTPVPPEVKHPRSWYLANHLKSTRPWIVHSIVPASMVEFIMREKKDSAIGEKFIELTAKPKLAAQDWARGNTYPKNSQGNFIPDKITLMEGVLHTFVVPVVDAVMHGDYVFNTAATRGKHSVLTFGSMKGKQLGRRVLISALVQQDWQHNSVMFKLAALPGKATTGAADLPDQISVVEKQDKTKRSAYDEKLRCFMVHHLTLKHSLPASSAVQDAMTLDQANAFMINIITSPTSNTSAIPSTLPTTFHNKYMAHKSSIISLEILFQTACHQIRNELLALEKLCAKQGYIYTWDPPVIFTAWFGKANNRGTEFMSLLHLCALKHIMATRASLVKAMRLFAWNDFHSSTILTLLRAALEPLQLVRPDLRVGSKSDLFAREGAKNEDRKGLYTPPPGLEACTLVLHNNSDGFGQNIETEAPGGSMDGALGVFSSTSACLVRDREDLCDFVFEAGGLLGG